MRVVILAAGAADMLCGSCLRDNRLATTLRQQGRDVLMLPMYTPLRTDEAPPDHARVFFGGINVYLRQKSRWYGRLPSALTRALDSPAVIRRLAGRAARIRPEETAELTLDVLRGVEGSQQRTIAELIEGLRALKPQVINLPDLFFVGIAGALRRALGARVVCTLSGEDLFVDGLPPRHREQALALIARHAPQVDAFIAVTRYYARHAAQRFGLPAERIRVVPLGIHTDDFSRAPVAAHNPFTIAYLARVAPEKGLAVLCEAFSAVRRAGHSARLRAAGYLSAADRPYLDTLQQQLAQDGTGEHFEYLGEVSRAAKVDLLASAHVFSVPATHPEAKGLYVLEALAAGVPVVQPAQGSFPELIEETGGGLLYDPAAPGALADALVRLRSDDRLRRELGARGRTVVREKFNDRVMAENTWRVYESLQ